MTPVEEASVGARWTRTRGINGSKTEFRINKLLGPNRSKSHSLWKKLRLTLRIAKSQWSGVHGCLVVLTVRNSLLPNVK
jgi:hypothetical protein